MKQLKNTLTDHKVQILAALVLAFLAAVVDQLVPRLLRDLMNSFSVESKNVGVASLLLGMAAAYIGAQLIRVLQRIVVERAATKLSAELMSLGMSHLVGNSIEWHLKSPVGQVHVRLERSAHAIAELLKIGISDVVGPLMGIAFALLLMFEVDAPSGFAALMVSLSLCFITCWQISNQNGVRVAINRAREAQGAEVVDAVTNIETVKLCGAEVNEVNRVKGTSNELADREFSHHKAMAVFDSMKAIVDQGGFVLVVAVGLWGHWDPSKLGSIMLIVLCYQRLMEPLRSLHRIVDEVAERIGLSKDFLSLQEPPPHVARSEVQDDGCPDCAISIRNLWFSYPGATNFALSDVTVDLPHGARVAIIGASGEGKSTLAKMISGILAPTEGTIFVNGARVQLIERQPHDQRKVAVLPQEIRLFSGTILDNIRYGAPGVTDDAVIKAATAAGIDALLFEPDGRPRAISARGDGVSGGQKQRIGVARVLLRDAPIVVLDEPTSAQDTDRRTVFFELVHRVFSNQTVIVITHDTGNLNWATHVIRLHAGSIQRDPVVPPLLALDSLKAKCSKTVLPGNHAHPNVGIG